MKQFFKSVAIFCATLLFFSACSGDTPKADYRVVPLPKQITNYVNESPFILDNSVAVEFPKENPKMANNAAFLKQYIQDMTGISLSDNVRERKIVLKLIEGEGESFSISILKDVVTIEGATEAGVFYGIQTLRKSLPIVENADKVVLPSGEIRNSPLMPYRGMMLDVSRHFFTVDEVKRYIDILALHGDNRFHWHLSDDQGWRIEIKKYPKLTEIGSVREQTVIGRNSGEYDGKSVGGFYTQEQIKEVIRYAADRYITIVPEIDMPGHMLAALTAYPELGCTGGPYKVAQTWGVFDDVLCVGKEATMTFIKDVLTEVIDLFPGDYIHVGGDECPKVRWKVCPDCQRKIRALGIKGDSKHSAEEYLQSYCISFAEKIINEKGKKLIGWDEILEGGIAPNATIMSWRGTSGGIEAAKQGHDVIMTPTSYFYFDYYQSTQTDLEPFGIGGYVPVEKVYSFNPIISELTPEQRKHIIGVQANLWVEYISEFSHVEYMVLPRAAALSEVQWMDPADKDYKDFVKRAVKMMDIYKLYGYNYAKHLYDISVEFTPNVEKGTIDITMSTLDNAKILYSTGGATVQYDGKPISIDKETNFRAQAVRSGNDSSRVFTETLYFSKSTGKSISMLQPINKPYSYNGKVVLVDGLKGGEGYKTGRWLGFYNNDMEAVIDLKDATSVSEVVFNTCVVKGDWILDAKGMKVELSEDGNTYTTVFEEVKPASLPTDPDGVIEHKAVFSPQNARFVKVTAYNEPMLPEWHSGKGNPCYIFVDEIVVR